MHGGGGIAQRMTRPVQTLLRAEIFGGDIRGHQAEGCLPVGQAQKESGLSACR